MSFDARAVDPRIRRGMRILENEQLELPSNAALATRVGLSPAHFSRMFAGQIGESSSGYGRRIRLDHSVNRMRYDPSAIGDVARDFGYESQAAFTRAFHEQFGVSPREYMNRTAPRQPDDRLPLPGPVGLIFRKPTPLAARRFFSGDQGECWRKFLDALPAELGDGASFVGLSYDDPRVTPPRHQRFDCCIVLHRPWHGAMAKAGLDAIELPGGLHGEVAAVGTPDELRTLFRSLLGDWLPTRPGLAPEGDPLPIFFDEPPIGGRARARVAIRVRERGTPDAPNAALLDESAGATKG